MKDVNGYLELSSEQMFAYENKHKFELLLSAQIESMLPRIRVNQYGWDTEKIKEYFSVRSRLVTEIEPEKIVALFRMDRGIHFKQEMSGLEFSAISKDLPIIWNECRVNYKAKPMGDTYELKKISQVPIYQANFTKLMRQEIGELIEKPSDFDDPQQINRFRGSLKRYIEQV